MNDNINELVDKLNNINTNVINDINDLNQFFIGNNTFTIFHLNIRSISKNFSQLLIMLNNIIQFIDCIVLTECWLNNCASNINIEGFHTYVTKYNNFNQNSGIVLYVKDCHMIEKVNEIIIDNCNCLNLSICCNGTRREIIALYRGHNNNYTNFETKLIELINNITNNKIIIIGDININIADDSKDELKLDYLNLMAKLGFYSYINDYTRVCNNTSTTIDHIFIRTKYIDSINPILLKSLITDHYSTLLIEKDEIMKDGNKSNIKSYLNIKLFCSLLDSESWEPIINETNINNCADKFHKILNNHINKAKKHKECIIPSNKRKIKPWITSGLIASIRVRDKLGKMTLKRSNDFHFLNYYKKYKNKLCSLIRYVKNEYYRNKIKNNSNNIKKVWNIIGEVINRDLKNKTNITQINYNNELININTDINKCVNIFNNHFITVGENIAKPN